MSMSYSFKLESLTIDMVAVRSLAMEGGMVYAYISGKASEVLQYAEFLVPRDTGELAESLYKNAVSTPDGFGWEIGATAAHALYQELGTVYHGPQAYLRPALFAVMGSD